MRFPDHRYDLAERWRDRLDFTRHRTEAYLTTGSVRILMQIQGVYYSLVMETSSFIAGPSREDGLEENH
jgi:hypothetical protein